MQKKIFFKQKQLNYQNSIDFSSSNYSLNTSFSPSTSKNNNNIIHSDINLSTKEETSNPYKNNIKKYYNEVKDYYTKIIGPKQQNNIDNNINPHKQNQLTDIIDNNKIQKISLYENNYSNNKENISSESESKYKILKDALKNEKKEINELNKLFKNKNAVKKTDLLQNNSNSDKRISFLEHQNQLLINENTELHLQIQNYQITIKKLIDLLNYIFDIHDNILREQKTIAKINILKLGKLFFMYKNQQAQYIENLFNNTNDDLFTELKKSKLEILSLKKQIEFLTIHNAQDNNQIGEFKKERIVFKNENKNFLKIDKQKEKELKNKNETFNKFNNILKQKDDYIQRLVYQINELKKKLSYTPLQENLCEERFDFYFRSRNKQKSFKSRGVSRNLSFVTSNNRQLSSIGLGNEYNNNTLSFSYWNTNSDIGIKNSECGNINMVMLLYNQAKHLENSIYH